VLSNFPYKCSSFFLYFIILKTNNKQNRKEKYSFSLLQILKSKMNDLPQKFQFPANVFDTSKPAANTCNINFVKRKLVEQGADGVSYLACFCRGTDGRQLPALKKTARSFTCNKTNTLLASKCGFRINQPTITHLQQHNIIKQCGELTVPVCKTCCGSWLLYSNSEKIRDKELQHVIAYVCNCDPFSKKINVPIDDISVSEDFDLTAYANSRGQKPTAGGASAVVKEPSYMPE
jgi:hypothetical protein